MTAPRMVEPSIDFAAIAAAALAQADRLVPDWLPEGKRQGAEWTARNPTRADQHPGSFKVNLDKGLWRDFATDDSGGDLISLYAYLNGLNQGKAALALAERIGMNGAAQPAQCQKPGNEWTAITPIPADAPTAPAAHPQHGKPAGQWTYRNASGQPLFHIYRFDPAGERKQFIPLTWCESATGGQAWRWQAVATPRPLYGLDRLADRPDASVMVCEGEKAADAASHLFPDWIAVTSPGGAQAPQQSDWKPVAGRRVVIWPDYDEPGRKYAAVVAKLAKAAGAADVRILAPAVLSSTLPDGWDAADALAEGWTADRLAALLAESAPAPAVKRAITLNIVAGELPELCDAAEAALIRNEPNLYQRNGNLVRAVVSRSETVHGIKRPGGKILIAPLDADGVLDRLNQHIRWQRWSERKSDWVACNAPRSIATMLLSRHGLWNFNPLVGVVTAPTLRPDGSVLDKPGYDAETGLLLVNHGVKFPKIPAKPTATDGRAALDFLIKEVLCGFPFAAPHDRSAALSAILTGCVRHSLQFAPLHAFDAPRAGSGKSLLANVVALIATGAPATVMTFTPEPDELRKRIMAVLLQGDSIINFDNLDEPLKGDSLCTVLTAETFSERVLGANRNATAPTACTWLATGNNLIFHGDMTRRVVCCQLDPQCERPEERQFSRNLNDWIPLNRPALVAAALTALRSYIVTGKPRQNIPILGGFEDWSNLIRCALIWLGEADPTAGRERLETTDPVREKLRGLLLAWFATFKTVPSMSKEAVFKANEKVWDEKRGDEVRAYPALYDVLSEYFTDRRGELSSRSVGNFIKEFSQRVEHGVRFQSGGTGSGARQKWQIAIMDRKALENALRNFSD